jgi:single-stranded-DNA-specific exonuclease
MTLVLPRWALEPVPDPAAARDLAAALRIPEALAALMVQRGFGTSERARAFLRPSLSDLSDPFSLAGMAQAVETVAAAVKAGRTILVHGDYDVDGQCSTAVLTRALRVAGARVEPFVPHRLRDGYDFGPAGLARARAVGATLILTCDCGITAIDTVRQAEESGIQVVVTDHHLPQAMLPPATAVVDPQRPDDTSGLGHLCGTGIAFKLVQALVPALGLPEQLPMHLLDYVALATVADVVPLIDENRILVRHGLKLLRDSRWVGLRALLASSGVTGDPKAGQVGFILAPRLNAAGRIGDAADGLRLLLTDDPAEAYVLATRLDRLNTERQALDQQMLDEAIEQVEACGALDGRCGFVLGAEGWHPGVVGIVASRVVERYGRPTFLVGFDGPVGKGSGRSISRFDLHAALGLCGDLLERFGGHRMAAGLTLRRDQFEAFRDRFQQVAADRLRGLELGPEQRVDLEISLADANADLERLCRHLEPCGMGNPAPVFGVRGIRFSARQVVGEHHVRGRLEGPGAALGAIGFRLADRMPVPDAGTIDAAFRLEENAFRGAVSLQARLLAVTASAAA